MFKKLTFLLVCLMISKSTLISKGNEFYIIPQIEGSGLFSTFSSISSFLDYYDIMKGAGFKIDFGDRGYYYEKDLGPNWWSYYFDPVSMGSAQGANIKTLTPNELDKFAESFFKLPRTRIHYIIQKYIHVKNDILKKVQFFKDAEFKDSYVIGIHYQADGRKLNAPKITYETAFSKVMQAIQAYTQKYKNDNWKIFVATDDAHFISHLKLKFPNKIIFQDAIRSSDSLPVSTPFKYKKGEEELIDCLLLSECHLMIKPPSSLSDCALCFNPSLPVLNIKKVYPW